MAAVSGPLAGVRVLNLSRILAGLVAIQLMGESAARSPASDAARPEYASDGYFIMAVGNDTQFRRFAAFAEAGLRQVFEDPQVRHGGMQVEIPHRTAHGGRVNLIGDPIRYSATGSSTGAPP
ncbi:MAG: hypothetical protein ACXW6K_25795, partial [Candidatus Binatia bacterium]